MVLILTRKHGEAITVDGPATIYIHEVIGDRVKVAIEAPRETTILRSELEPHDES